MEAALTQGEQPLISVIITSYNYAHYLHESISSVLTQDVYGLELIVVDNASTDNSDEIAARFTADPRFRYIKNETNIGLAPNHNKGLALARGQYILFVSADDRLLPGHLRRCLDYLEAHPAVDMVYTGVIFIDANSRPYDVRNMLGQLPVEYAGGRNEFAAQLSEGCYIAWPSMLARRSLYDECGPLHLMTAADYEITVRWAAARKSFGYLRTPSVCIRLHAPQASGAAYIARGEDLSDYIDIVNKFVVPDNFDLLQGYQRSLAAHLAYRANAYREANGGAVPTDMEQRIADVTARVAAIPIWRPDEHLGTRPLISVVMRSGTILQLLYSLQSLAAQVDAPAWEAIVVAEGGPDLGPLLRAHTYADRVRYVRMDETNVPGAARNLGQRLAGGRIITYLEAGNTFAPQHLANLASAFAGGATSVRSDVRLLLCESHDGTPNRIHHETIVNGLVRGEGDDDRDLIAAAIPVDAIAHISDTIERTGRFRADIPVADVWEYWLRVRSLGGTVFMPGPTVDVRVLSSRVLPSREYLNLAVSVYRAYPSPDDSQLSARRATYLRDVTPHFDRGPAAIVDAQKAIEVLASLYGIEGAVLTP
jgi:glycosyltransferase involved in cell wall biosynthesis